MTLLFVTQKLHEQDAFVILWVKAFMRRGYTMKVLCLEDRVSPQDFEMYSMGKERGVGKIGQVLNFWKHIAGLQYDRVFIHMSPIWGLLGSWYWMFKGMPIYLWYTHYKRSLPVRVMELYAKRIFCATEQSVPWLRSGDSKKVDVGHGIDLEFWKKRQNMTTNPYELLVVHRLSRSKRLEIALQALKLLSENYTMVIYGIEAERDYVEELHARIEELCLQSRVEFKGTIPMEKLPDIYSHHRLIVNMALETIDKTMLEAMTCGCYPVTTRKNAEAIGLSVAPEEEVPEAVAAFIRGFQGADPEEMFRLVVTRHSLDGLVENIDRYMKEGS